MQNPFLKLKDVSVKYGNLAAIQDINIDIEKGEIISIIGPNGSGKSTMIKAILNLINYSGEILLEGQPVSKNIRNIGYMPQTEDIDINFPITIKEVVWQSQYKTNKSNSNELVTEAIELNQLKAIEEKNINELSGGQLQRTFLARAMAQDGDMLILDEPFSNMDISSQNNAIEMLNKMKEKNKTILITTHNLKLAQEMSTKIILLNKKIICYGTPDLIFKKQNILETFGEDVIFTDGDNISVSDHHSHQHKHK